MILQMQGSSVPKEGKEFSSLVNYGELDKLIYSRLNISMNQTICNEYKLLVAGMLNLVLFSYMLPFVFFVVRKGEMKL